MGKTRIVRQLRNGQITIPKEFRDALHLGPDDLLSVELRDNQLFLRRAEAVAKEPGSPWLKELYDLFAPARQRIRESGMTEDEINAEIDAAIREVRAERKRMRDRAS